MASMLTFARTSRAFRRAYVIGLLLIMGCSLASFAVLRASIATMSGDTAVMRVSGEQAALADRAALLLSAAGHSHIVAERNAALDELERVTAQLVDNNTALIEGDPARALPGNPSAQIRALHEKAPVKADAVLRIFHDLTDTIISAGRAGTLKPNLAERVATTARTSLADAFSKLVAQYEREADARIARLNMIHLAILLTMLMLLAIEARFIFIPAARQIDETTSEMRRTREDLDHAATHDTLTGLANRRLCQERLDAAIEQVREDGGRASVFHLDLDGFKAVNDTLGHAAGDDVLWQVAERLRKAVREDDTVSRVGGDEFVLICPGHGHERDPEPAATRIMEAFATPFVLVNNVRVDVGCSIGISRYPGDAEDANDLLVAADLALYRAKENGKNRFLLFDPSMREEFNHKIELARRVKQAVDDGEFEMFYQPQVEIDTGRVVGMEALLRWRDPEKGLRAPSEFLEIIERSGGMQKLGAFVVDRSIEDAARWHHEGISFGRVGINISAAQLRDTDFIDSVLDRLFAHGLPPNRLAIEIVEGAVISGHSRRLRALLDELNDLDINVEFDDFGTGYASLTHLRQLPVNRIKIDQSFVTDLTESADHRNIVHGLIKIVHRLDLSVIAEGVETVEQARLLRKWGCGFAQGFLFARPAPVSEMTAYLRLADHKRSLATIAGDNARGDDAEAMSSLSAAS